MSILFGAVALAALFYLGLVVSAKNGYTVEQLMNPFRQLEQWLNKTFKAEPPKPTRQKAHRPHSEK